ncbi:unnamed protein product [Phytomonas sp. Hart1]|nr:unnamed protein product [Phytomonas sp. Hart1]|eukprot:CCW67604.1 unnamed protein product [Phytomonas sp. isolate Hart1]
MSVTTSDEDYAELPHHGDPSPVEDFIPEASFGVASIGKASSLEDAAKSSFSYSSRSMDSSARIESLKTYNVMEKKSAVPQEQHYKSSLRSMSNLPHQQSLKESYISASSLPTHEDLYERRRHRLSNHQCNLLIKATHDSKESNQKHVFSHTQDSQCGQKTKENTAAVRNQTTLETNPAENTEFLEIGEDALLKRMRRKEKEFDTKIKEINQTFSSAGRQLVLRDDLIEELHREILELRGQLDDRNVDKQQSREGERRLMESIQNNTHKLQMAQSHSKLEKERLHTELDEYKSRCAVQQAQIEQLREELDESHRAARESKQHHTREIDKLRKHFHKQLSEISAQYNKMDREHAYLQENVQQAEKTQRHAQAKVLQAQFELRQQRDQGGETVKSLLQERDILQEKADVAHLSIARLLSVLSCVPDMQNYLTWNEINSEFVFLAYPIRYFPVNNKNLRQTMRDTALENNRIHRRHDAVDKGDDDYVRGYDVNTGQPLNIETNPQTGIEDGIYAGSTSFQKTKNIWLNGQWIKKLQEIIDSENIFTRLKRIKLMEMEEAAKLCNQLPTAQDVLQCRRQERDYWVPYEVFIEAQQFKNKYCPRVPALSHFYPFLMKLNTIWSRKLQERLRVLRKELQVAQQQVALQLKNKQQSPNSLSTMPISQRYSHNTLYNDGTGTGLLVDTLDEEGRSSRLRNGRCHRSSRSPRQVHRGTFLLGASRNFNNLFNEHSRLRREVRLHITSQRSLSLFRYYDQLVKLAMNNILHLVQLCEQKGKEDSSRGERRAYVDNTLYESTDSDEHSVDDVPALPTPPRERREHRSKHGKYEEMVNSPGRPGMTEELEPGNRTAIPDASSIITLKREAMKKKVVIGLLTCTVQGTCKRVDDIMQTLFTRTIACCVDLEKLMRMVQYKFIPKLYIKESRGEEEATETQQRKITAHNRIVSESDKKATDILSSNTSLSRSSSRLREAPEATSVHTGAMHSPASQGLSVQDIQQDVSSILRSRYIQKPVATYPDKKHGQLNEEGTNLQNYERARPQSGGPRGVEALSQVVASVLDFTSEVKVEVQNANNALETVLNQAISESGVYQHKG